MLVGGFSGSDYLRGKVKDFFMEPSAGRKVPYMIPVRTAEAHQYVTQIPILKFECQF